MAIANGGLYYTPPANIVRMADDLAFLPAYFSGEGDSVLLKTPPEHDFSKSRSTIFGLTPRIILQDSPEEIGKERIEPWGWNPRDEFRFKGVSVWTSERKELYSRETARKCLMQICDLLPFTEKGIAPSVCRTPEEVRENLSSGTYVLKAPWSSSGKGLLYTSRNGIEGKDGEWLTGVLRRQGYVMVEKYLDKVMDFAMEFRSEKGKLEFIGLSAFFTGENGEYKGNYVGPQIKIIEELERYIGKNTCEQLQAAVTRALENIILSHYEGFLGVDMMIYRDREGNYKVQPCVEINLRYNMGILALFLSERYLAAGSTGCFTIRHYPTTEVLKTEHEENLQNTPLATGEGKIKSGYLNLTPIGEDTRFLATLRIQKED